MVLWGPTILKRAAGIDSGGLLILSLSLNTEGNIHVKSVI